MLLLQCYNKHNVNKRSFDNEDSAQDLTLIVELLNNLLSKDFIDFDESKLIITLTKPFGVVVKDIAIDPGGLEFNSLAGQIAHSRHRCDVSARHRCAEMQAAEMCIRDKMMS